ncbi:MAG: lamin tail domain-containing protein [Bacteroidales bacterium]
MKKILLLPLLSLYLSVTAQTGGSAVRYPATGDVVISEIMADPTPSRGLPEREYLEIFNRTGDSLATGGILLIAGPDTAFLSTGWIEPGGRIILCSTGSRSDLLPYGQVMAVKSFPSLNDAGELIALRDPGGSLIHAVSYGPWFLGDGPRSGGGWSAELIDPDNPFHEPFVWSPSSDPSGGTPGKVNSTLAAVTDNRCPRLIAAWPAAPDTLAVLFDETVMLAGASPWLADGRPTLPATSGDPADRTALVPLDEPLVDGRVITVIFAPEITDFAGNTPCLTEFRTGLPAESLPGEILFNELMPDPSEGQSEYIELYNNSGKIFDLSRLFLASGSNAQVTALTAKHRQLLTGKYIALTTGTEEFREVYPCADDAALFRADRLPSLPNDGGSLILYDKNLNIIDRMDYTSAMHMPFLSGTQGVALEKVSPSLPSDVAVNWRSASEACNWGSPGASNSVLVEKPEEKAGLTLSSGRVSPDGDGFEDLLLISLFPGGDENIITVTVFDDRGYPVRRLAERVAAGVGTSLAWDGLSDQGARLPAGLYIILAESFNPAGVSGRWKKVCAVLYR